MTKKTIAEFKNNKYISLIKEAHYYHITIFLFSAFIVPLILIYVVNSIVNSIK